MGQILKHLARRVLRMPGHVDDVEYRGRRYACRRERGQRLRITVEALQPGFDHGTYFRPPGTACDLRRETLIGFEIRATHGAHQCRPLRLQHRQHHITLFGAIGAVGANGIKVATESRRLETPFTHHRERNIDVVHVHQRFELRDIDVLAFVMQRAVIERGGDGKRSVHAGIRVAEIITDVLRRTVGLAGHGHHTALGLGDDVEAGEVGVGSLLTESRDRTHHQGGIDGLQGRVVEAVFRHHARTIVLDHHICIAHQRVHQRARLGLTEIHRQGFLAGTGGEEEGAHTRRDEVNTSAVIATRRALYLDHLGAKLAQQTCRGRSCQVLGEVEHFDARQHLATGSGDRHGGSLYGHGVSPIMRGATARLSNVIGVMHIHDRVGRRHA